MANISSRLTRLEVMNTTAPIVHVIMPLDSLDGEYLAAKIFEIKELELRLSALEAQGQTNG